MDLKEDRRRFERAIFSLEDEITGVLSIPEQQGKSITVYVINLSAGGMQFTLNSEVDGKMEKGDRLVLMQIKAPYNLGFLLNIDVEVMWVLNPPMLEHVGVGCAFLNIPESSKKQIEEFVDSWNN
jgi:c-di-GMP-binding flagellar brake protein YcgR